MNRRGFLTAGAALASQSCVGRRLGASPPSVSANATDLQPSIAPARSLADASGWRLEGDASTAAAVELAAKTYAVNRRRDLLSQFNATGFRMTVSRGFPIAMGIVPDLTFAMLGCRYLADRAYLDTLAGHADLLPRNMRRNGKFFINEDLVAGCDRVMSQVMYPLWIWELFRATGDRAFLDRHVEPIRRCLEYIESRTDAHGVVNQVDHEDWQISEGADWVDWCPERMEGSTCVYHTWYAYCLASCVHLFQRVGDAETADKMASRAARQRQVLAETFWAGAQYDDNVNYLERRVTNFWCDSQIWPIAFGLASQEQAQQIFARLDAEPELYLGCGLRWCAPVPGDQIFRPLTWFGRLGAGLVLARCLRKQPEEAWQTVTQFTQAVITAGTFPECFDMHGKPQEGTGGAGDYLEHAAGLLYCLGRGVMGLDDEGGDVITWRPQLAQSITTLKTPFWREGRCWRFMYEEGRFAIDPQGGHGEVQVVLDDKQVRVSLAGERVTIVI